MPEMTGLELLQRQSERGCKIDIKMKAIVSGYADEELVAKCRDLGCSFFEKPFSFSELSIWLSECERHFNLSQQLNVRRANSRYAFKQDIEYCLHSASSQEKFIGITFDKSDDGLGLRVFNPLYVGAEVEIIRGLEVPHQRGLVRWCSKQGENTYRAGLRLL
jgi:CheY-like chemotaxis protein